ncbi:arylalkylamine N-acetyltransferase 1-like [Chrysoperla carnea]|uniref:arylalkylamine N-acetyltransferase 1-like n=1 Tax=Chrysoperla carnea TaxID=189513 RepID=UPI001D08013D|nr:arylalkylamine N-acetyltransferase 1-like [Chrysoperla carnea]
MEILDIPPERYNDVIIHLRNNFFPDEPLNASMRLCNYGEAHELLENHSMNTLKDGLSVMAVDKSNLKIGGVALNGILRKDDIKTAQENLEQQNDEKFKTIFRFLYEQNMKINLFEQHSIDTIFECRILSVDSDYRGLGIAKKLLKRSLEVAQKNNFKIFKADATGLFSQRVNESLGCKTILEVKYTDYKDKYDNQVFQVSEPHEYLKIMVKDLSS